MRPSLALWLKVFVGFGAALVAVQFVPRAGDNDAATPPVEMLLLVAVVVALVTTAAFFLVVKHDLGLPTNVALFSVGWAALVSIAKFALGPHGFYEVNQEITIEELFTLEDLFGATATAIFVLALYGAAYWVVYRLARGRIETESRLAGVSKGKFVLWLVVGAILVAAGTGGMAILLPLLLIGNAVDYLTFVFSSSVSLMVGLVLGGAATLTALAFRSAGEQARVVGDAAALVSLFWVGLAFLALYHALWVVYVLVLTSLWPLRVIVPK